MRPHYYLDGLIIHSFSCMCSVTFMKILAMAIQLENKFHTRYTPDQIRFELHRMKISSKIMEIHAKEQDSHSRARFRYILRPQSLGGSFTARHFLVIDEVHAGVYKVAKKILFLFHFFVITLQITKVQGANEGGPAEVVLVSVVWCLEFLCVAARAQVWLQWLLTGHEGGEGFPLHH